VAYQLGFVEAGVMQLTPRNPMMGNTNSALSPQAHMTMTKANFNMIFRELGNLCLLD